MIHFEDQNFSTSSKSTKIDEIPSTDRKEARDQVVWNHLQVVWLQKGNANMSSFGLTSCKGRRGVGRTLPGHGEHWRLKGQTAGGGGRGRGWRPRRAVPTRHAGALPPAPIAYPQPGEQAGEPSARDPKRWLPNVHTDTWGTHKKADPA